jgi:HEPN domain-containing protein
MPERSRDWIRQAEKDLEAAEAMMRDGFFEWSCFISQQAAEKSVKAVIQNLSGIAWGHSILDLVRSISKRVNVSEQIEECARDLDKYYVPARYPNSFESGSPYEFFTKKDAEHGLLCARRIVRLCKDFLA